MISSLFGHKKSSEPSVLSSGVRRSGGCSQRTPCLGTTCLCKQKERWLTSCLKRNSPSIINERVPMEKKTVLISLLDTSKALNFRLSLFLRADDFSVAFLSTHCHPLIFPAALYPLSCSMLCCILALPSLRPCILSYLTDVISLSLHLLG